MKAARISSARMFVREVRVPFFRTRVRGVNFVFTLHQAAATAARRNVAQNYVARYRAKQGDACSDQYRHPCDHQSVDEAGRQESLNGDAAVYKRV
jgi:hypothetical protein